METRQLALIDNSDDGSTGRDGWRLDERTRQIGRDGIAAARRALRDATADSTVNQDTQSTAA